jgi:hypothetical protein
MGDEKESDMKPETDVAYWLPTRPDADLHILRIDFIDGHPASKGAQS